MVRAFASGEPSEGLEIAERPGLSVRVFPVRSPGDIASISVASSSGTTSPMCRPIASAAV